MRRVALAAATLLTVLSLQGCTEEPQQAEPAGGTSVEVTIENGAASPMERVQVERGEPVELVVKSDEPGSLHVHTSPEQELDYTAGTTTLTLTIDEPGVVEVESHELETVVLQLEVR